MFLVTREEALSMDESTEDIMAAVMAIRPRVDK